MKNIVLLFAMVFFSTILLNAVNAPGPIEITHSGGSIHLDWNAVIGATDYKVFSCDTPYGTFIHDDTGSFDTPTSWTKNESSSKRFYQVTAKRLQTPVELGVAGEFVILAESGITNVPNSEITGDIGISPGVAASITAFNLSIALSGTYSTSTQVTGKVYASDYLNPTPVTLISAIADKLTAYNDAAGRISPDFLNHGAGNLNGLTLEPGLYKWDTGVLLTSDVTISGGPNDVWIFQIGEGLTFDSGATVILSGGAQPKNIIWQSAGVVALRTAAHLEGIVLCATAITLGTGATVNGRLMAQTAVTLDQSVVTQPAP